MLDFVPGVPTPYPTIKESAGAALNAGKDETCHGCGVHQKGGVCTPCTFCGEWGLFCLGCMMHFKDGSCSLRMTRCAKHVTRGTSKDRDYFSASQVEAFKDCQRKWAWRYIDGVDGPPNLYAAFGLKVHGQIERYLKDGIPFDLTTDEGESAMAGLHHLPRPGTPGMAVEKQFILEGWGHRFLGYKDIQVNRVIGDGCIPGDSPILESDLVDPLNGQLIPLVIDHKTTGNFRWAKSADELRVNTQAVLYAADAMVETSAPAADLRWIYYKRTRPFQSKVVNLRVYREDLERPLADIQGLANEMSRIKSSGLRALDLPPNPGACGAYGGCPYVKHCNLSPQESLLAFMSNQGPQNPADLEAARKAFLAGVRTNPGAGTAINPQTPQGAPPGSFQPPPGGQSFQPQGAPPGSFQPPPNPGPSGPPPEPQIDEQVLIQARGVHPNWQPGQPWWDGKGPRAERPSGYVNPGEPDYPPVYVQPQNSGQEGNNSSGEGGKGKGGRPKKNAEAIGLAAEGCRMIGAAMALFAQAIERGLFG